MVENKKRIEITVEETGQSFTLVANELIGQVRSILLNKRKFDIASRPWNALDKETQQSEIDKLENFAEELVIGIVEIVAAGNMEVIHAKFDGMTMKPDGSMIVKVAGYAEDDALVDLNHMRGKLLKITAVDQSQFDQHREAEKLTATRATCWKMTTLSNKLIRMASLWTPKRANLSKLNKALMFLMSTCIRRFLNGFWQTITALHHLSSQSQA